MVRRGVRLLSGVNVQISKINQLLTPQPDVSDKNSPDIGVKLRYVCDRSDDIYTSLTNVISVLNQQLTQLQNILSQLQKRPTGVKTAKFTLSGGTAGLTQQLFTSSTPVTGVATIYRNASDTGDIYVGDSNAQDFPLPPGSTLKLNITDLSTVYVNVPAGVTATLYVIWEV